MLNDSGNRTTSKWGALSDPGVTPRRYDLIPPKALRRLAKHYANGSAKYEDWNWAKGFMFSTCTDKLLSHFDKWRERQIDEDHLAATAFWIVALMHFEETGRKELDDRHVL